MLHAKYVRREYDECKKLAEQELNRTNGYNEYANFILVRLLNFGFSPDFIKFLILICPIFRICKDKLLKLIISCEYMGSVTLWTIRKFFLEHCTSRLIFRVEKIIMIKWAKSKHDTHFQIKFILFFWKILTHKTWNSEVRKTALLRNQNLPDWHFLKTSYEYILSYWDFLSVLLILWIMIKLLVNCGYKVIEKLW